MAEQETPIEGWLVSVNNLDRADLRSETDLSDERPASWQTP